MGRNDNNIPDNSEYDSWLDDSYSQQGYTGQSQQNQQSGYINQQNSYTSQQNSYTSQQNWEQPQQNWEQPQQNWEQPQQNWEQPQQNGYVDQQSWNNQNQQFNTNQQWQNTQQQNYGYNQQNNPYMNQQQNQQWQQPMYPQQPIYIQQPQNNGNKPPKQKKIKNKKPKKHKFLRFLFKTAAFVLIVVGAVKGSNYLAEKDMDKFALNYPFEFVEGNSLNYVTDNFKVNTEYEFNGKTYKVKWDTNDSCVSVDENGNVIIYRPESASRNVVITQTYKKLLGKAERVYNINVIASSVINKDSINVISIEDIKNGDYNRDMDVVLDSNGNLEFMMGDFKNTFINSVDDALVLLEAYREQFNVDSNATFKLNKINNSEIHNTYIFDVYLNDVKVENKSAIVVTKADSFELTKISIDASNLGNSNNVPDMSDENMKKHMNIIEDTIIEKGIEDKVIVNLLETSMDTNGIIYKYIMTIEGQGISSVYEIWIQNNQVVKFEDTNEYSRLNYDDSANCTGVNEKGEKLTFEGSYTDKLFGNGRKYILYSPTRNIHSVMNHGSYELLVAGTEMLNSDNGLVSFGGMFVALAGLAEMGVSTNLNSNIVSDSSEFDTEDAIAVQSFDNIQDAYDFYLDEFGLISYDNKGSIIKILNDHSMMNDNASWNGAFNVFSINPSSRVKYSTGMYKEVLGHEYTHAVFGEKISGSNNEVSGLNEAYADIMGCIIAPEVNWEVCRNIEASTGKEIVFRDIKTINSELTYGGDKYPEKYKDDLWYASGEEEHAISVMISNIGYKMFNSKWFDSSDVAHIWYTSLDYGYDSNSTYVTCRKYIIQAAEDLGYEAGAIDFIAKCFDDAEILDPSYVFKTTQNEENIEEAADGKTTIKTTTQSITGDAILDDTTPRRYIIAYSPADLVLGEGNIVVYEEREGELWFSKDEETANRIEKMLNERYPDLNLMGNDFTVEYMASSPAVMSVAEKFCRNSKSIVKNMTFNYIEQAGAATSSEDREIIEIVIDQLFGFIFQWKMTTSTPYQLFDNLGLIE